MEKKSKMAVLLTKWEQMLSAGAICTYRTYRTAMRAWGFEELPTFEFVQNKITEWLGCGIKKSTISTRCVALKAFMRTFPAAISEQEKGRIVAYMNKVKVPEYETRGATGKQVERILGVANEATALAISIMYYHGLRIGDVWGLRLSNFHRESNGRELVLTYRDHKTEKLHAMRLLPVPLYLFHRYINGERSKFAGQLPPKFMRDNEYLFLGKQGHYSKDYLASMVKKDCRMAGFPELHCHSFRHGCGTTLAKQGVPLPVIQKILGHSSISSTMRYINFSNQEAYNYARNAFLLDNKTEN